MAHLDVAPSVRPEAEAGPAEARARIEAVLERLAEGDCAPREVALWRLIVPQMADWLEPAEGAAACRRFDRLVKALEAPVAAK